MNTMRWLLLVGAVAVVGSLSACTFFPLMISQTADGSLEAMSVGERIVIHLTGNPSAGYEWVRVAPESLAGSPLDVVEEGRVKSGDEDVCGAPGTYLFEYRAVEAGTVTLRFEYKRSWEETVADTFSVVIWVR